MQLSPGSQIETYTIFLSSASDLEQLRDYIAQLVESVVNPELYNSGTGIQLRIDRWEHGAPKRAPGNHVNEEFVKRAVASHVTMVLLRDRLGPGTVEEFEAVLEAPSQSPELSVFRFQPSKGVDQAEVERLDTFFQVQKKNHRLFLKEVSGAPDSIAATNEIFRFLFELVLTIITRKYDSSGGANELR